MAGTQIKPVNGDSKKIEWSVQFYGKSRNIVN